MLCLGLLFSGCLTSGIRNDQRMIMREFYSNQLELYQIMEISLHDLASDYTKLSNSYAAMGDHEQSNWMKRRAELFEKRLDMVGERVDFNKRRLTEFERSMAVVLPMKPSKTRTMESSSSRRSSTTNSMNPGNTGKPVYHPLGVPKSTKSGSTLQPVKPATKPKAPTPVQAPMNKPVEKQLLAPRPQVTPKPTPRPKFYVPGKK